MSYLKGLQFVTLASKVDALASDLQFFVNSASLALYLRYLFCLMGIYATYIHFMWIEIYSRIGSISEWAEQIRIRLFKPERANISLKYIQILPYCESLFILPTDT